MGLHFLVPKAYVSVAAIAGVVGALTVHDTVNAGSIIVACLVVIVAGIFTLRNNMKTFWKNLAEERGEQVKVLQEELRKETSALAQATIQQAEIAAKLKLEEAKRDLTGVVSRLDKVEELIVAHGEVFDSIDASLEMLTSGMDTIREHDPDDRHGPSSVI